MSAGLLFQREITMRVPALAVAFSCVAATTAFAQQNTQAPPPPLQLPICAHRIGSVAIERPGRDWWSSAHLSGPETLLKAFAMQSGCFTVVARGAQLSELEREREIAGAAPNAGLQAADFIMQPDLSPASHSSGVNLGALFGRFVGGPAGSLLSNVTISSQEADVTLAMTNVRSGEEVAIEQGHAQSSNLNLGGGYGPFRGLAALGALGYADTPVGQVVAAAYLQAYTNLVIRMGGIAPPPPPGAVAEPVPPTSSAVASNDAAGGGDGSLEMVHAGRLYAKPSLKSHVVASLTSGQILYPTGKKDGVWVSVSDEAGEKGWVSSLALKDAP
jgi:curli biogenesis system outer membrane secretion channel CsgG